MQDSSGFCALYIATRNNLVHVMNALMEPGPNGHAISGDVLSQPSRQLELAVADPEVDDQTVDELLHHWERVGGRGSVFSNIRWSTGTVIPAEVRANLGGIHSVSG